MPPVPDCFSKYPNIPKIVAGCVCLKWRLIDCLTPLLSVTYCCSYFELIYMAMGLFLKHGTLVSVLKLSKTAEYSGHAA